MGRSCKNLRLGIGRSGSGAPSPRRILVHASQPRRVPAGPAAIARTTAGDILLTVNAARRSDTATNARVAANTSALGRVLYPSEQASPDATIVAATSQAR